MAAGIVILAITRPYECALLCLPVVVVLGRWLIIGKNRSPARTLFRLAAAPLLLVTGGAAWMGYYDYRAFGSPTTLPYTISRATYAMAPYYVWQKPRPEPAYRHQAMRDYYDVAELQWYTRLRGSPRLFLVTTLGKAAAALMFFAGAALIPPLFMLRRVLLDRRIRFLVVCVLVLAAGMLIEIFLLPHYLSPFTAAFYAIGLQGMRHLRVWNPGGQPVGKTLVRLTVTLCLVMAGLRLYAGPLHFALPEWPSTWNISWYGPDHFGTDRDRVETGLGGLPGKHLVIVRYTSKHNPFEEWVYNAADIDASKVVWAREMDLANNLELIRYFHERKIWLVEPDSQPAIVSIYPLAGRSFGAIPAITPVTGSQGMHR